MYIWYNSCSFDNGCTLEWYCKCSFKTFCTFDSKVAFLSALLHFTVRLLLKVYRGALFKDCKMDGKVVFASVWFYPYTRLLYSHKNPVLTKKKHFHWNGGFFNVEISIYTSARFLIYLLEDFLQRISTEDRVRRFFSNMFEDFLQNK